MNNPLNNTAGWMGEPNEPLKGFSWDGGKERHTSGVAIWSDIFLYEKNGVKYAIVVMDTQGLFDNQSRTEDSMRIFSLNALLSSFLIYNLVGEVREVELEYLQLATDYAELVNKISQKRSSLQGVKPFQDFLFLIRDWPHIDAHPYGKDGGKEFVNQVLDFEYEDRDPSLNQVREYIADTFDNVYGYLMPHPGKNVTSNRYNFHGELSRLPEEFKKSLKELLEWIFSPEQLKVKRIFGQELDVGLYLEYVRKYCKTFKSTDLPEVKTLYQITVDQQLQSFVNESFEQYKLDMNSLTSAEKVSRDDFIVLAQNEQENAKKKSLKFYDDKKKLGTSRDAKKHRDVLKNEIDNFYAKLMSSVQENHQKYLLINQKIKQAEKFKTEKELNATQQEFNKQIEDIRLEAALKDQEMSRKLQTIENEKDEAIKNMTRLADELRNIHNKNFKQEQDLLAKNIQLIVLIVLFIAVFVFLRYKKIMYEKSIPQLLIYNQGPKTSFCPLASLDDL